MNHWRVICTLLALAVLLLAAPGLAQANGLSLPDQPQAPLGTGFIYQGYLTDGEGPADGAYDFQFSLYSVQDGGSPLGTLTLGDQAVTEGYFTVLLDFGAGMFDGSARWLAISVRGGAETGAYTSLDPRQALSAAPYAMYAPSAGAADNRPVIRPRESNCPWPAGRDTSGLPCSPTWPCSRASRCSAGWPTHGSAASGLAIDSILPREPGRPAPGARNSAPTTPPASPTKGGHQ